MSERYSIAPVQMIFKKVGLLSARFHAITHTYKYAKTIQATTKQMSQ